MSIVSIAKEKVWYHTAVAQTVAGAAADARLKECGGCAIWYDEPACRPYSSLGIDPTQGGVGIPILKPQALCSRRHHFELPPAHALAYGQERDSRRAERARRAHPQQGRLPG